METIRKRLESFDGKKVDIFIQHLNHLKTEKDKEGKQKNWWFSKVTEDQFADAFIKVADKGLFIDGDSVSLSYRKGLAIVFDYHAYKNKVLLSYPDSIFDFQLVREGDEISFRKESGKVIYNHVIADPFKAQGKIIGAYGVIKNKRGEFLETLNMEDIQKMQNTAQMQHIWKAWFDRMVLKSVIKRICSIHFKDITEDIDKIDNEHNEPNNAYLDTELQEKVDNAKDAKELETIYKENVDRVEDKNAFIELLAKKKKELKG